MPQYLSYITVFMVLEDSKGHNGAADSKQTVYFFARTQSKHGIRETTSMVDMQPILFNTINKP